MKLSRDEPFLDDRVHHRVQERDVGVRLELQVVRRVPRELGAPRVGENELRPVLHGILDPRRRHRMIDDGVGADQQHDLRLHHVHHRIGHRARADALEQRRDARRVAKPRAMVDVVGAESGAHELLEEIRFLVRALRRAESRQRAAAVRVADLRERAAGQFQRLLPARFAEHGERIRGIHHEVGGLRHAGLADQRLRQPLRMVHVVEAEAALDAQPLVVRGAVAALDANDRRCRSRDR